VLEIFVDADACPVKGEVERVADRHQLTVHIVSNGGLRPSAHPRFRHVTVADGADAADNWIAEHIQPFDIAITADVPLASRCLKKNASVIGPSGKVFTPETIGMALGVRELNRHLREVTGGQTIHSGFTKQDRSRFLGVLENEIQALKRRIATSDQSGEVKTSFDAELRMAIAGKRLVQLRYSDSLRVVEPHDYGVQKGTPRLLAYQTRSLVAPSKEPGWRVFDVPKIAELVVLDQTFKGSRNEPDQQHHEWDVVYARVG